MGFGEGIDWEELHRNEERRQAEEAEARSAYYASLEEKQAKHDAEINALLSRLGDMAMAEEKAKMEMEQADEEKRAVEAVRERYRKAHGEQEWTSTGEDHAWHAMARSLFGEG